MLKMVTIIVFLNSIFKKNKDFGSFTTFQEIIKNYASLFLKVDNLVNKIVK